MMFITLRTTSDLDDLGTEDTKGKTMCAVVVCGVCVCRTHQHCRMVMAMLRGYPIINTQSCIEGL